MEFERLEDLHVDYDALSEVERERFNVAIRMWLDFAFELDAELRGKCEGNIEKNLEESIDPKNMS